MTKKVKKGVKKDNKKKLVKKIVKKSVAKTLRINPIPIGKPVTARDAIMMRSVMGMGPTGGASPLQPLMTKRESEEKKIELLRAKKDEYEKNISDMKTKESNLRTEVEKKMKEEKEARKNVLRKSEEAEGIEIKGYDFNSSGIGGPVYRYNFGIKGKPEYFADIQILNT